METPKTLLFEVREHVAHITLNRPEVSNAMNLEMSRQFYEAAFESKQRTALPAVLTTGPGRAFCSGPASRPAPAPHPRPPPPPHPPPPPFPHPPLLPHLHTA